MLLHLLLHILSSSASLQMLSGFSEEAIRALTSFGGYGIALVSIIDSQCGYCRALYVTDNLAVPPATGDDASWLSTTGVKRHSCCIISSESHTETFFFFFLSLNGASDGWVSCSVALRQSRCLCLLLETIASCYVKVKLTGD